MRVQIKGIHRVRKTLSDGRRVEYHYAWRGGPRFWRSDSGVPRHGPDYFAAYREALAERSPARGLFREVITSYLKSPEFRALKDRTRKDIEKSINHPRGIDAKFGDAPRAALDMPGIRRIAYQWRDGFAASPRQADHMLAHLRAIVSWAHDRGFINQHHLRRMSQLYRADRSEIIWLDEEIAAFEQGAPAYIARILVAATETGLRPGDLARLSRAHIRPGRQGSRIVMRTGKRDRMVSIPVTQKMQALIDATPSDRLLIITGSRGRPYSTPDKMGQKVGEWRDKLGLRKELRLYDARGTAATRLFSAGATLQEIATAMGWSPAHAARMIEVYCAANPEVSDSLPLKLSANRPDA